MDNKPLLFFPEPVITTKKAKSSGPQKHLHVPPHGKQIERLDSIFTAIENSVISVTADPAGTLPEQVIVFEIVDSIDEFFKAVNKIPGMEWLSEWEKLEISPDEDFYYEDNKEKQIKGRLYLVWTNQESMQKLLSLWKRYKKDPSDKYERGLNKWRHLFTHLYDIRKWDTIDRIADTGILEYLEEKIADKQPSVRIEMELWFRNSNEEKEKAKKAITEILKTEKGKFIKESTIPEINYHGILGELSAQTVQQIVHTIRNKRDSDYIRLLRCDHIMFFRPVGQIMYGTIHEEVSEVEAEPVEIRGEPIIALLDGLPLENHQCLSGKIVVDDPDDWGSTYESFNRNHGTAMASLIVNGDIGGDEESLSRPIYVRPVMKPDPLYWGKPKREMIPDDELEVDIIHRAVKRLFENGDNSQPAAEHVKVINLSIGNSLRLFDTSISPLARLLDWLSYKYKVQFFVSAGNHQNDLELEINEKEFEKLDKSEKEAVSIKAIKKDARNRRLLSPSEAINVITVGSLHSDESGYKSGSDRRIDIFKDNDMFSPINALGHGFRRSVKPDILMSGGRQLYLNKFGSSDSNCILEISRSVREPGQQVACPGSTAGVVNKSNYCCGTSNATAIATRTAGKLYEMLEGLKSEPRGEDILIDEFISIILKGLITHGAMWPEYAEKKLVELFKKDEKNFREFVSRFLGYGIVRPERIFFCEDNRATLIGCGVLSHGEAHIYSIPVPDEISGKKLMKQLTMTLAWYSPIVSSRQAYRGVELWFDKPEGMDSMNVICSDVDRRMTSRGTIQHEVFKGERAGSFPANHSIDIKVNCRNDALSEKEVVEIPYSLIATLEVGPGLDISIYEKIKERIRQIIKIA